MRHTNEHTVVGGSGGQRVTTVVWEQRRQGTPCATRRDVSVAFIFGQATAHCCFLGSSFIGSSPVVVEMKRNNIDKPVVRGAKRRRRRRQWQERLSCLSILPLQKDRLSIQAHGSCLQAHTSYSKHSIMTRQLTTRYTKHESVGTEEGMNEWFDRGRMRSRIATTGEVRGTTTICWFVTTKILLPAFLGWWCGLAEVENGWRKDGFRRRWVRSDDARTVYPNQKVLTNTNTLTSLLHSYSQSKSITINLMAQLEHNMISRMHLGLINI